MTTRCYRVDHIWPWWWWQKKENVERSERPKALVRGSKKNLGTTNGIGPVGHGSWTLQVRQGWGCDGLDDGQPSVIEQPTTSPSTHQLVDFYHLHGGSCLLFWPAWQSPFLSPLSSPVPHGLVQIPRSDFVLELSCKISSMITENCILGLAFAKQTSNYQSRLTTLNYWNGIRNGQEFARWTMYLSQITMNQKVVKRLVRPIALQKQVLHIYFMLTLDILLRWNPGSGEELIDLARRKYQPANVVPAEI